MKLKLDVVTPEQILLSQEVEQVVVPGAAGEFGVLVQHAPTISNLKAGVIRVFEGSSITKKILVSGGVVEVTPERCAVLATEAYDFASIDKETLEKRLAAIKKIHDQAKDENEKGLAEKEVHIAQDIVNAFIHELDHHK